MVSWCLREGSWRRDETSHDNLILSKLHVKPGYVSLDANWKGPSRIMERFQEQTWAQTCSNYKLSVLYLCLPSFLFLSFHQPTILIDLFLTLYLRADPTPPSHQVSQLTSHQCVLINRAAIHKSSCLKALHPYRIQNTEQLSLSVPTLFSTKTPTCSDLEGGY